MSSRRRTRLQVEPMERRELLSHAGVAHPRKNVDISGEVMRMNVATPPRTIGRAARVYSVQGTGGVAELGSVQVRGSATDNGRGGSHVYKGNLTLANSLGTVNIAITAGRYRITGGTGTYRGAVGLGVVSYGTSAGGDLVGIAFDADH